MIGPKPDWIREAELREDMPRPQGRGSGSQRCFWREGRAGQRVWQ